MAIENDAAATLFLHANLTKAGVTNAEVASQDVGDWLEHELKLNEGSTAQFGKRRQVAALQTPVDFLLLDPPRTGAESRVINGILNLEPQRICYVSCDPATLARDLRKLLAGGYDLKGLAALDMFPQTHHVETVVHMKR